MAQPTVQGEVWTSVPRLSVSSIPGQSPTISTVGAPETPDGGMVTATLEDTLTPEVTRNTGLLPAGTLAALEAMPLRVGNAWIYDYQAYSMDQKAHWQVADTVVAVEENSPYIAGQIERVVSLIDGSPGNDFIHPPRNQDWWIVVGPGKVFFQATLNWNSIEDSNLELVLPLAETTDCWYVDAQERQNPPPALEPGCRQASPVKTVSVAGGEFSGCYRLVTPYNDGSLQTTFCPGVGFIAEKYDHAGSSDGYDYTLQAYVLQ
jgi:hypothetical protein